MRSALPIQYSARSPPEREDAGVLQETAEDAAHPDGLLQAGHAGLERADAAHHQLDRHARLRAR